MKRIKLDETFEQIFLMDIGAFKLFENNGRVVTALEAQELFNEPYWKSYYINKENRFIAVDNRNGKMQQFIIRRFPE